MRRYWGYFRNAFGTNLMYRTNCWLGIVGALLSSLIHLYLWQAVYATRDLIAGYALSDVVTYTIVSASLGSFLGLEMRIDRKVRDGSIAMSLIKPADWHLMVALETLGKDVFRLGAVCVPVYLLFLASGTILPPASSAHALAFLAAIGLGWTILFGVCYLSGLASFFTKAGWGFVEMQIAVIMFFAGTAVPLAMYPTWLQQVAAVLPFKAIYYMPINVYLGKVALESVPGILVSQALWAAALAACGRLIWCAAAKRLTVQGG